MDRYRSLFITGVVAFYCNLLLAQNPAANFLIESSACKQQVLNFQNTSANADAYSWDFCLDDLLTAPTINDLAVFPPGFGESYGYKLINSNGNWFGFITSRSNHRIYRLDFGQDPTNLPVVTDLGNPGGLLSSPEGIDVIQANGNWYGFVGSLEFSTASNGVIRLDFGSSLQNVPSAFNLGNFGFNTRFRDVKVIHQSAEFILVLMNYNENSIVRVNYRDAFENIINSSHVSSTAIAGANLPIGFDVANRGADLIMTVASLGNDRIIQLNFGSSILNTPSAEGNYSFIEISRPYKIKLIKEGGKYFGIVSNESLQPRIIDFSDLNVVNAPVVTSNLLPIVVYGLEAFRWKGKSIIQGSNSANRNFHAITFESRCGGRYDFSSDFEPAQFYYSSAGVKKIELVAINTLTGENVATSKTITINDFAAPDIEFHFNRMCSQHDVDFTITNFSNNLNSYTWSFGDSQTSIDPNPTHQYSNAGNYNVSLQVAATNGCNNFTEQTIKIYDLPIASFNLPVGLICTNNQFAFTNNTTDNFDGNLMYQWQVNNIPVAITRDLNFTFLDTESKNIKLITSIPGCTSEATQTITNVQSGPAVGFEITGKCEEESIYFTNTSSGDIAGFTWNLGNNESISNTNPTKIFSNAGTYTVTLQSQATNGCVSSTSKNLTIYSKPQANFSISLPPFSCAGSPSQFNDLTPPLTDSNITSWTWNFGDVNATTSTIKNPAHEYSVAGDYNVGLSVSTNFGCQASVEKVITILPSPVASFQNGLTCLGQNVQFVNTSGSDIKSSIWKIQNQVFNVTNPPLQKFGSTGSFPIQLTVTANNGCQHTLNRNIQIQSPPTLNFSIDAPCTNNFTTFLESITEGSDLEADLFWTVNGESIPKPTSGFTFPEPGIYEVKLSYIGQSGCTYYASKNVTIQSGPVSIFTASDEVGAAPLSVKFTNNSTPTDIQYRWSVMKANSLIESETSKDFNYSFSELGDYKVELVAKNDLNCVDRSEKLIRVVVPEFQVELLEFRLIASPTGAFEALVSLKNNSNVPIQNPEIILDVSGGALLKETLTEKVMPGNIITRTLDVTLLPRSLQYVCAEVLQNNDQNPWDNRKCLTVDSEPQLFAPFPNPAKDVLFFEWISNSTDIARVFVYNSSGQMVFEQKMENLALGLNQIRFDLTKISVDEGLYFFSFQQGGVRKVFRFMVSKD